MNIDMHIILCIYIILYMYIYLIIYIIYIVYMHDVYGYDRLRVEVSL